MEQELQPYFHALANECPDEHTYLRVVGVWLGLFYALVAIAIIIALSL